MNSILTAAHRIFIDASIAEFSRGPIVLIIDNVPEWCRRHNIEEYNPSQTARAFRVQQTGKGVILLASLITPAMRRSVEIFIEQSGYSEEVKALRKDRDFLKHLVLHEIAHLNYGWGEGEESLCDEWAFAMMGIPRQSARGCPVSP
ncbi:MAG: hypothetical protein K8I29_13150 [Alphaproteobacteria bacterium]|uniref:Uncharacterized protein n=1 Tax=Candidatus Nitrobium versatile TaxID=2884831 RepID=A0A953JFZ6_9BACT|nr:hypothetical protein [Candidatus Nitrobium versatile]